MPPLSLWMAYHITLISDRTGKRSRRYLVFVSILTPYSAAFQAFSLYC